MITDFSKIHFEAQGIRAEIAVRDYGNRAYLFTGICRMTNPFGDAQMAIVHGNTRKELRTRCINAIKRIWQKTQG